MIIHIIVLYSIVIVCAIKIIQLDQEIKENKNDTRR